MNSRRPGRLPGFIGIVAFAALSFAIWSGALEQPDRAIILALRMPGNLSAPVGPAWLAETGRDITGLGSNAVMGLIALTAIGSLAIAGRWRNALTLLTVFASAQVVCGLLKTLAQRPRPDLFPGAPRVFTTSFPSSHAMVSAATLLSLAAIVAELSPDRRLRIYCAVMALIGTGLIGFSRIYLGVHWPSDVAAGWIAGALCAWGGRIAIAACFSHHPEQRLNPDRGLPLP